MFLFSSPKFRVMTATLDIGLQIIKKNSSWNIYHMVAQKPLCMCDKSKFECEYGSEQLITRIWFLVKLLSKKIGFGSKNKKWSSNTDQQHLIHPCFRYIFDRYLIVERISARKGRPEKVEARGTSNTKEVGKIFYPVTVCPRSLVHFHTVSILWILDKNS